MLGKMAHAENRWAVIIGISEYQDQRANLQFTADDAKAIYHVLSTKGLIATVTMFHMHQDNEADHCNSSILRRILL